MKTLQAPASIALRSERGLSLVEAIAATVITVIAVLGLAHTFGIGRGLVHRFEVGRVGLATAQESMEILSSLPATSNELAIPACEDSVVSPVELFLVNGAPVGTRDWVVKWVDDPTDPAPRDLKRVTVRVRWQSLGTIGDSLHLTRLILPG